MAPQKNELGRAWSTREKWETYKTFWLDKLTRRGDVHGVGTEGRISMNRISGKKWEERGIRNDLGQVRVNEK